MQPSHIATLIQIDRLRMLFSDFLIIVSDPKGLQPARERICAQLTTT